MARQHLEWCDSDVKVLERATETDGTVNFYAPDSENPTVIHLYRRQRVETECTATTLVLERATLEFENSATAGYSCRDYGG